VRHLLSKHGGSLGENGCVAWMFEKKGLIVINKNETKEEALMDIAIDAGAEDITVEDDVFEIVTLPDTFISVKNALEKGQIPVVSAELTMIPKTTVKTEGKAAEQVLKLMDALEDNEDIQHVYSNFDIDEADLEA
jgi:YebC/PmpR family DNA-binding regulatory protein